MEMGMFISFIAVEQLQHFTHEHPLSLVKLKLDHNNENSDEEEEDEDEDENKNKDDFMVENQHVGKCKMCEEEIYSFHQCYYSCKDCDYSLHKFCAQLPTTELNHPSHPGHNLTLALGLQLQDPDFRFGSRNWACAICNIYRNTFFNYYCSICDFNMDIICATMSQQKMDHPSHPHQLQRYLIWMVSCCNACGRKHSGTFYHCTTCSWLIHLDCALLPTKLLIQQFTNTNFSHSHLLTLAYSFPYIEKRAKFFPRCRVCDYYFSTYKWNYRCDKCQYYTHVECATSRVKSFKPSIFLHERLDNTYKNSICCPFPDESSSLLKLLFENKGESIIKRKSHDVEMFSHSSHKHPLVLIDLSESFSLHDPMKKVELLCDGCVRPITGVPFYKCSQHHCDFVLHEWCTRLPSEIQDYHGHPEHTLVLMWKIPTDFWGMFMCRSCLLPSNGFAYGCKQCAYYVDINCGFIPDVIRHEAHPNHLLLQTKPSPKLSKTYCKACYQFMDRQLGFHCPSCDLYLHAHCCLLLPKTIRHKYDKHPLSLRYYPAENHSSEYFCDICEDAFDPKKWFYHCSICASSMHPACAPLKLQCELSTYSKFNSSIFWFLNVKFGGTHKFRIHPHLLSFVQGISDDGQCDVCHEQLQYYIILKCFLCKFACHNWCVRKNTAIRDD